MKFMINGPAVSAAATGRPWPGPRAPVALPVTLLTQRASTCNFLESHPTSWNAVGVDTPAKTPCSHPPSAGSRFPDLEGTSAPGRLCHKPQRCSRSAADGPARRHEHRLSVIRVYLLSLIWRYLARWALPTRGHRPHLMVK